MIDKPMPVGIATVIGRTGVGLSVCGLRVHRADARGRWVIVGRRFATVEGVIA